MGITELTVAAWLWPMTMLVFLVIVHLLVSQAMSIWVPKAVGTM